MKATLRMNNTNTRVHINIKSKLIPHTADWIVNVQNKIQAQLLKMERVFSETDFKHALKEMEHQQLTLAGVTFLLYVV